MQSIVVGGLLASWLIAEQLLLGLARKSDVAGHTCGYELYFRLHCNKCPLHTVTVVVLSSARRPGYFFTDFHGFIF